MAVYPVKCYFDTGLYLDNCLENLAALDLLGFTSITLDGVWLLQNREIREVKVAVSYERIKNVDYCVIGDTGYWVNGITMVNENVCVLSIQPDYITSIGVANIKIIDGWATRRCVTNDEIFSNTIEEPFTPMKPLKLDFGGVLKPSTVASDDYRIVVSTVDLETAEYTAQSYKDEANDLLVTVPQVPVATQETTFQMGDYTYKLPKAGCYNYDLVNEGVQAVRSLGIESCITASYTIPRAYVQKGSLENTRHAIIVGVNEDKESAENIRPEYANVKNKKALTGQFMKYTLMSLITGETQTFPVEEIESNGKIKWKLLSDPLPEGFPIAMPSVFHKSPNTAFYGAVKGAVWQQNPIQYTMKSGAALDQAAFDRSITGKIVSAAPAVAGVAAKAGAAATKAFVNQTAIGMGSAAIGGAAKAGATAIGLGGVGIGTLVGGAAVAGVAALAATYWFNTKKLQFQTQQNIIAPDIPYTPVHSLQNYYGNFFQEFRYRLDDSDLENFDRFLSAYGYAVSEPLTTDCFKGRVNFNYIEAENVLIKTPRSKIETLGATEQITNGVRIWHTAPSQERLYNNPIKEV